MIGLLVRALAARAEELVRLDTGYAPYMTLPRPTNRNQDNAEADGGTTVEFRMKVFGPANTVYVVTIAEVRA